jgi:peptidoglycan hydrolase-like protein with peptidoglycan-binding domain
MELKEGDSGSDVQRWQRRMVKLGWTSAGGMRIRATGVFGRADTLLVKGYQCEAGLPISGIVDEATWQHILETPIWRTS